MTINDRARNAFFYHYVTGFSKTYDMLASLTKRSQIEEHLAASIDVVSLAFFCFQFNCSEASQLARERYLYALPLLNKALKSPISATSDSTLLSVLFLDLFEKITNNNPRSSESWMSHVNGALALVTLRRDTPFRDHAGLRLSIRLSTNLLISCIAANAPVPSTLTKLRSDLEPFLDEHDPKWQVSGLVIKYADLRGAIQRGHIGDINIIIRALDLDHEFISLASNMPFTWLATSTYTEEAQERVLDGHFDMYPDHFITQTWNVLRIMRILLNDIVCSYCTPKSTWSYDNVFHSPEYSTGIATIDMLAKEICASAPQYTGHQNADHEINAYSESQRLQCYTLLFPLYVAGKYASPTTIVKPWIVKLLRLMANEIGIRNADAVAQKLEKANETSIWDIYALLGSYAFAA